MRAQARLRRRSCTARVRGDGLRQRSRSVGTSLRPAFGAQPVRELPVGAALLAGSASASKAGVVHIVKLVQSHTAV